jgi:periplasmic divalent cation tolerance protein
MTAKISNDVILVLTNLPDQESAEKLAQILIQEKMAACVNMLAPCTSFYEWQGQLEKSQEIPLLINSTHKKYSLLENCILRHHPYELPEIISVPIDKGLPSYLNWVQENLVLG